MYLQLKYATVCNTYENNASQQTKALKRGNAVATHGTTAMFFKYKLFFFNFYG